MVTLICDGGDRYADTYYADDWVAAQGLDLAPHLATVERFLDHRRLAGLTGRAQRGVDPLGQARVVPHEAVRRRGPGRR